MSTMNFYVPNRRVACTPFESLSIEAQGKTFKTVKEKNDLISLTVVYGNHNYSPGTIIYVRGDVKTLPWTREIFDIGLHKVILVPEDCIQIVYGSSPE